MASGYNNISGIIMRLLLMLALSLPGIPVMAGISDMYYQDDSSTGMVKTIHHADVKDTVANTSCPGCETDNCDHDQCLCSQCQCTNLSITAGSLLAILSNNSLSFYEGQAVLSMRHIFYNTRYYVPTLHPPIS